MKQGLERTYDSGSSQAGKQGSARSNAGEFGSDFHNVISISSGVSDWQGFDADGAAPVALGKGTMSLAASLKLANWLNSNRVCLAVAAVCAFSAAALCSVQFGGSVVELAASALALLLVVPFGLIITVSALIVRLESPGPAIYRQTRVGQRRVPFTCYKLRSMRTDVAGSAFTIDGDPRVTRFGAIMRKWRIDEMPQLWNVLRGDMSWIGPRPEAIPLAAQYRRSIPNYSYRYLVPPGITGWAAVHQGNVGEVDAAKVKLEYDFYYIRHLSFWMDVLVILKTVRTVVTGFGSR